jgi:hypothetical protein
MDFTLLQFLSGSLAERLNITPGELLSALNTLSAIPYHPYDQVKYELFGPEQTFKTFQEIEMPESFNIETAKQQLSGYIQKHDETVQMKLSAYESIAINESNPYKEFEIFDNDMAKKNIVFSEAVRSLTHKEINEDPIGVANKVISFYLNL